LISKDSMVICLTFGISIRLGAYICKGVGAKVGCIWSLLFWSFALLLLHFYSGFYIRADWAFSPRILTCWSGLWTTTTTTTTNTNKDLGHITRSSTARSGKPKSSDPWLSSTHNHVQRPQLHPSPPQPQRHKRSQLLPFCIFPTSNSSATAISISSHCLATENSVYLGTADCTRGKCGGKTFFCLASAAATEVYD
jgi:hypothetical protein